MKTMTPRLARGFAILSVLTGLTLPVTVHANAPSAAATATAQPSTEHLTRNALVKGIYQLEYSPKRHMLYAAVAGDRTDAKDQGTLLAIDPNTLHITARMPTQARPFGLALDDDLGRLYTSDTLEASISMFDLQHGGRLMTSTRLSEKTGDDGKYPYRPREIRLDAAHHRLYVSALAEQGRIYVLDSRTLSTISVFDNVGKKPTGLALDTDHQRFFLSNGDGDVQIRATDDGRLLGHVNVGTLPLNLLYDAASQRVYATDYKGEAVVSIDVHDSALPRIEQRIATAKGPVALLALPSQQALVVTEHDAGTVAVFDLQSGQLRQRVTLEDQPNSLAAVAGQPSVFVSVKQARAKDLSTPGPDSVVRIDL